MNILKKIGENAIKKAAEGFISPEDKRYMGGKPNRIEVANYVNSLMESHYMPLITNYIQMSSMVIQAILIEKGVCTGEEIKKVTEKFVEENQRRTKVGRVMKEFQDMKDSAAYFNMENGLIKRLDDFVSEFITGEKWKSEDLSEDERKSIYPLINTVFINLVSANLNKDDEDLIKFLEDNLPHLIEELTNLKSSIENGTITIKDTNNKIILENLIKDSIERLSKGLILSDKNTTGESDDIKKS